MHDAPSRPIRRRPARTARNRRRAALATGFIAPGLIGLALVCGAQGSAPAAAQNPPTANQEPVLLSADSVTFDERADTVTASGNVELSQGARTVRADTVTYNRTTRVVTATGGVRLVEPTGEIVFADYAELTDDLRDAFIDNIRILMTDDSRMAGNEGERADGRLTRINRGVYSPCELCKDDPTSPPLWQVRAVRVVHDKDTKEVRYRDAVLELFGVPVAYTPYLSHPDPTVNRRTGMLAPVFGRKDDLGVFVRTYTYVDIAPDQDATVEVSGFSEEGLLLGGEYRKRFEHGTLQLTGSITEGELKTAGGDFKREEWRGHIAARGLFDIDEVWRTGFDVRRASDRTYLRRYYNVTDDILTSRAFVEGFRGRNYAAVNAYSFQDTRYYNTTQEPLVLPEAIYSAYGEPGGTLGGRWSLEAGALSMTRGNGPNSFRVSVRPGWRRDLVSSTGLVTTLDASVLAAAYSVNNYDRPDIAGGERDANKRFRLFPQADVTMRYPMVRYGESSSQTIEPIASITAAPNVDNDPEVPNEDSLDIEFNDAALFMPSRYTGIDRLEGGVRATYGLRASVQGYTDGYASLFLGQSYRFTEESDFPTNSGLETRRSDFVGRLDLVPAPWLDINYGFRLDEETLKPRQHSLTAAAGLPRFRVSTNYTFVDTIEDQYTTDQRRVEQATFGVGTLINRYWSASAAHVQAFSQDPGARATFGVLTYHDECFTFDTIIRRDFTDTPGETDEGTSIYFRLVFKNIGEVTTPSLSGSLFGRDSSSP